MGVCATREGKDRIAKNSNGEDGVFSSVYTRASPLGSGKPLASRVLKRKARVVASHSVTSSTLRNRKLPRAKGRRRRVFIYPS